MTHAELLRRDAELAIREGGMYYSGEYLSRIAAVAESLEAENAKLLELAAEMYPYAKAFLQQGVMLGCTDSKSYDWYLQLREAGIEVER